MDQKFTVIVYHSPLQPIEHELLILCNKPFFSVKLRDLVEYETTRFVPPPDITRNSSPLGFSTAAIETPLDNIPATPEAAVIGICENLPNIESYTVIFGLIPGGGRKYIFVPNIPP